MMMMMTMTMVMIMMMRMKMAIMTMIPDDDGDDASPKELTDVEDFSCSLQSHVCTCFLDTHVRASGHMGPSEDPTVANHGPLMLKNAILSFRT